MISSSQSWLAVLKRIGCRPVIRASALGKERMVFFCHTDALSR
jgi:hypothetical protein